MIGRRVKSSSVRYSRSRPASIVAHVDKTLTGNASV
jgi:hypothetical protein